MKEREKPLKIKFWRPGKVRKLHKQFARHNFKDDKFYKKDKFVHLLGVTNGEFKAIVYQTPGLINPGEMIIKHKHKRYSGRAVKRMFKVIVPRLPEVSGSVMENFVRQGDSFLPDN